MNYQSYYYSNSRFMDRPKNNEQNQDGKLAKKIKNFIYHPTDVIGSGFSSNVYKGINQLQSDPNKKTIAIKVIELSKVQNEVEKYLFNNEVNALKTMKHPNVLNTIDILMTKNNVYLITEFCEGGDLLKHIKKQGVFSELEGLRVMRDIVSGYICVEEQGIIHRDLKTANIFLKNGIAKIADFGFCEFVGEKKPKIAYNVGSPAYMSPQSYKQNHYSPKSDIWGIGIILYEIIVGETPDKNLKYSEMVNNLMNGRINKVENDQIRRILTLCFKKQLNERITAKNLLELINAEIKHLETLDKKTNMVNRPGMLVESKTPVMLSSVPPNMQGNQPFRENRIYSPAKRKEINFNRIQVSQPKVGGSRISQNNDSSRKHGGSNESFGKIKNQTELLLFLYRLLKFLGTESNVERIIQIHLILFRHRNYVDSLVNAQNNNQQQEEYQQYFYLRSRFDEVYLQIAKNHRINPMYKPKFNELANANFLDPEALRFYNIVLNEACQQCIRLFTEHSEEVNWNQLGVIFDYIMIEFEIISLHLEGRNFHEVVKLAQIDSIIRQQPNKVTQAHLQLLKLKYNKLIFDGQNPPHNAFKANGTQIKHVAISNRNTLQPAHTSVSYI